MRYLKKLQIRFKDNEINKILLFIVLTLFISNALTKYFSIYWHWGLKVSDALIIQPSTIYNLIILLFVGILYLINCKVNITLYIFIGVLIFISPILLEFSIDKGIERSIYLIKYVFPIILFIYLSKLSTSTNFINQLIYILILIGKFNLILIFLGFLFNIEFFRSYPFSNRFGYNGIISQQGMGSYFYIFLMTITYYKFIIKEDKWSFFLFTLVIFLLGTKGIVFFAILLSMFHFLFVTNKVFLRWVFSFFLVVSIIFSNYIINIYANLFPFGKELLEKNGETTFLLSKRNLLLNDSLSFIENNWKLKDYLFGTVDFTKLRTELELFDIFLFFGILGMVIYLSIFFKLFLSKKLFSKYNLLVYIILLVSALMGNLLLSVFNSILFTITILYLKYTSPQKLDSKLN